MAYYGKKKLIQPTNYITNCKIMYTLLYNGYIVINAIKYT